MLHITINLHLRSNAHPIQSQGLELEEEVLTAVTAQEAEQVAQAVGAGEWQLSSVM